MSRFPFLTADPVFLAYLLAFGGAAVVCFASVPRARGISDPDTRRGLMALLLTSGGWAITHVGFLAVPSQTLKIAIYQLGLVVGFSTVGAWLYFCSAYTGRTLHRSPEIRRLAVGVYLVIVAVKLTNPLHHLYFSTEFVTSPFSHLAIQNHPFHWVVMGLAYALALVGYFMLVELFWQVGHDTTPLVVLVALTGLPGLLDFVGAVSPRLVDITYGPLGVAAFAVGVLYLYVDVFQTVRLTGGRDDPVVVVDDDNYIRDYNTEAEELFADLATGEPFGHTIPELVDYSDTEESVVEIDRVGGMRYYQLSVNPFMSGQRSLGQVITFADITDREQYRRELEDQNERLDQFAGIVSHDLRNPLNVAMARINIAREQQDSEHLEAASRALDRMGALIEDVLTLARDGGSVEETEEVSLSAVGNESWKLVDTKAATLTVESDITFQADAGRLRRLFENIFRNAIDHGDEDVSIRVGALPDSSGFFVEDDGPGIPADERDLVFESGHSTSQTGSGLGLAIVKGIVDAHGWEIAVTEGTEGGARFEITGLDGDS